MEGRPAVSGRLHAPQPALTYPECRWLACHALGVSTAKLLAYPELMDAPEVQTLLRRREKGEPLQYIIGDAPFFGRDFCVGPGVLIPRNDTETLISAVKSMFPKEAAFSFLDWGTGSGCIAITLLLEFPESSAVMAEKSPKAAEYAMLNIERYGLENRAEILKTDMPDDIRVRDRFDAVISNPPYIPTGEIPGLMRDVRDYEPHEALDGGDDGLDCYRALFRCAPRWLKPGGLMFLEMGSAGQTEALKATAFRGGPMGTGLSFVREFEDSSGFPRCSLWRNGGVKA